MTQYNVEMWIKEDYMGMGEKFVPQRVKYLPYPVDSIETAREILRLMKIQHYRIYEHSQNEWMQTGEYVETTPELQQFLIEQDKKHEEYIAKKNKAVEDINALPEEIIIGEYKDGKKTVELFITRSKAEYRGHGIDGANIHMRHRKKGSKYGVDDHAFHIDDYRSKDGKILRKQLERYYGSTEFGKAIIADIDNICKKYDDFEIQIKNIKMRNL
jgi:hypothetical protein